MGFWRRVPVAVLSAWSSVPVLNVTSFVTKARDNSKIRFTITRNANKSPVKTRKLFIFPALLKINHIRFHSVMFNSDCNIIQPDKQLESNQMGLPSASSSTNCDNLTRVSCPHSEKQLELKLRSPYEKRLQKFITTCPKCLGNGKVLAKFPKRFRAEKSKGPQCHLNSTTDNNAIRVRQNDNDFYFAKPAAPSKKPCRECGGSGLRAISPASAVNYTTHIPNHGQLLGTVAIIGGGIGGIALAVALQHRNIPCIVYERDLSFEERKQGYGLTMQQGARALKSLGLFPLSSDKNVELQSIGIVDSFNEKFGIHSTRHVVHRPDGTIVGEWGLRVWGGRFEKNDRKHANRQNSHISRQDLRKLLLDMLNPETVKWGYKFLEFNHEPNELVESHHPSGLPQLKLRFQRKFEQCKDSQEVSEEVNANILVGCDGIRSVVRMMKLGEDITPLRYLGCIVILGIAPTPDSSLTDNETVFQTADGVTRLYAMPFARSSDESSISSKSDEKGLSMWQLSFPMEEPHAKELSQLGSAALKAEALRRCGAWHDPIPLLLNTTPEELITGYPCYDRALVEREILRRGFNNHPANSFVTLLGDAAHPMSPFKGQGANQALLDAVLLAQKLSSILHFQDRKPNFSIANEVLIALEDYENEMLLRCASKVVKSADAAKFLHSDVAISEGNMTRGAVAASLNNT